MAEVSAMVEWVLMLGQLVVGLEMEGLVDVNGECEGRPEK